MIKKISAASVLKLDVVERIQLVEDLWDSIASVPEAVPLTKEQEAELEHRLQAYHKNPSAGSPWAAVKKRILSKR